MTTSIVNARRLRRHLVHLVAWLITLIVAAVAHADAGDFQAMPGLWKIVTHVVQHGKTGPANTEWHCVDEDADPWIEFADLPLPAGDACQRGDERRSRTSLAWTLTCPVHSLAHARGQVAFDTAEHYTGSLATHEGADLLRVEGQRYAACTSPKD